MKPNSSAMKQIIHSAMKPPTDSTMRSDTRRPPSLIRNCAFGCTSWCTSRRPWRSSIITRATFRPPTVEPEQPPITASVISPIGAMLDQVSKPCTAKPVVVIADTAWKVAKRSDCTSVA